MHIECTHGSGNSGQGALRWRRNCPAQEGGGGGHHQPLTPFFPCNAHLKPRIQGSTAYSTDSWLEEPGDRELPGPSPPGPINSISWVGPGGPNTYMYNENGPFLASLGLFFSNCNGCSCIGGFGHFETLRDPFPRGPPRPNPPPPPPPLE